MTMQLFIEELVSELKNEPIISATLLEDVFPEIFENSEHIELFKTKLLENNMFIPGVSDITQEIIEEMSNSISILATSVAAKKYLNRNKG